MKRTKQSILLLAIVVFCCSQPLRSQETRLKLSKPNFLSIIMNSGGLSENEKGVLAGWSTVYGIFNLKKIER
jgi:hypothetical protein